MAAIAETATTYRICETRPFAFFNPIAIPPNTDIQYLAPDCPPSFKRTANERRQKHTPTPVPSVRAILLTNIMTTSAKMKFRPSRIKGKVGTIYILVIHNRVARQISTGYKLHPHEWKDGEVVIPDLKSPRHAYLMHARQGLQGIHKRIVLVTQHLESQGRPYTTDEIVAAYRLPDEDEHCLRVFARKLAEHLKRTGKHRLSETYTSAVNSFLRFRGEKGDIRLDEIDETLIGEYEHYLLDNCGLCRNTSSFYNRNLRAIYNRAVKQSLTTDRRPFAKVYTGVDKTAKRAVSIDTLKVIKDLDLTHDAEMAFARDLYMMSFNLRGISFVDMAMLETNQLKNGYLTYFRQKTRQKLEIKWEKQMQEIIDRHHVKGSRYLLPILSETGNDPRQQYLRVLPRVNAQLKKIGKMVGCPIPLTTYTARHGWASVAHGLNIATPSISQALGHNSEKATRIYLNSLDNKVIDDANRMVLHTIYA